MEVTEHARILFINTLRVFMSHLTFQFIPPSPSHVPPPNNQPMSAHPFSTSASLFLIQNWAIFLVYHFSRFHIHALMCNICVSLSDLLHSIRQALSPSMSLQITQFHSFSWLSNIPLYICTTSSLSIHLLMGTWTVSIS